MASVSVAPASAATELEQTGTENTPRCSFGVGASFDLNMPGDLLSSDKMNRDNLTYGLAIGGLFNMEWRAGWFAEVGCMPAYDRVELPAYPPVEAGSRFNRLSVSVPVSGGYWFRFMDSFGISPVVAVIPRFSFYTGRSGHDTPAESADKLSPFDFSCGIGCGFKVADNMVVTTMGCFGLTPLLKRNISYPDYHLTSNMVSITMKYFFR